MENLSKDEIIHYLETDDENEIEQLFSRARAVRENIFGNKIFIYGFVYFSTYCRNNCNFCYFRNENNIERYRKSKDEVVAIAKQLTDSGVNLIDLTMGEDELYHDEEFETVLNIVKEIKKEMDMPVMLSSGVLPEHVIDEFADAGTDWYALYQETHNRELFEKLRINQSYDVRMNSKLYAIKKGILVEEGLLAGVGESAADIAESFRIMGEMHASQIRVMSFIPQEGSPMADAVTPDRSRELKMIAIMRILYPNVLIPASLDVDGIQGLKSRVMAGANVVTSIIPPRIGLMGVAQSTMDVDEGERTAEEVREILKNMGLEAATNEEYKACLQTLRKIANEQC